MRLVRAVLMLSLLPVTLSAQRVAVIDAEAKALVLAELSTGKVEKQLKLQDPPTRLIQTPDGSKLVVLSRGTGKKSFIDEFLPTTRGSVTVVDAKSLAIIGRVEGGFGEPGDFSITPDSAKAFITFSGATKANKPASLYAIDLGQAKEAGRVEWTRACGGYPNPRCGLAISSDRKSAAVFFHGKAKDTNPTLMKFVDLETVKESGSISLVARTEPPVILPDGDTFYLLDNPLGRSGTLHAISFSKRAVINKATVGGFARIAAADPARNLIYVTSQTQAKGVRGHNGQLQAFREGEEVANIKTIDYPTSAALTADGKRLYVMSETAIGAVDTTAFKSNDIDTKIVYQHHMMLSPDGKRAYFYLAREEAYCCGIGTFDLVENKPLKTVSLGSTGSRILQALEAVAASVDSYKTSKAQAKKSGKSSFTYTVYKPEVAEAASGMMYLHEGTLWAIDPQGGGVGAIDAENGAVRKNLQTRVAGHTITPFGAKHVLVVGEKGVAVIDAEKLAISDEWILRSDENIIVHDVGRSANDRSAVVVTATGARGISRDGKLQPMIEGTKDVVDWAYME